MLLCRVSSMIAQNAVLNQLGCGQSSMFIAVGLHPPPLSHHLASQNALSALQHRCSRDHEDEAGALTLRNVFQCILWCGHGPFLCMVTKNATADPNNERAAQTRRLTKGAAMQGRYT